MKELHSEIEIDAPAERVWHLLTDFASYPRWNPFIRTISGQPTRGERLDPEWYTNPPPTRVNNGQHHFRESGLGKGDI